MKVMKNLLKLIIFTGQCFENDFQKNICFGPVYK